MQGRLQLLGITILTIILGLRSLELNAQNDSNSQAVIRAEVDVVNIIAMVRNKKGEYVRNLVV